MFDNDIFPPDITEDIGKVRVLIADTVQLDYDNNDTLRYRVSDAQISVFLEVNANKLLAAAASALLSIAADEGLINKVIKTEDLQTDGAKLATELRLQARDLWQRQKARDEEIAYDDGQAFIYIPSTYPYKNLDW